MAGQPKTRAQRAAEEAERAQRLLDQANAGRTALERASARQALREMDAEQSGTSGGEVLPPLPTVGPDGQAIDSAQLTREELSRRSPGIARRLCRCAMGELTLTFQEIQASKLILDKLVASAVQRVDLRASVEVRDKRATIEALITALSRPGAVGRGPDGAPVLNLPATVTEARLARADGRGEPIELRTVDDGAGKRDGDA
jgi:hypothetical protein